MRRCLKSVWRKLTPAKTIDQALERLASDLRDGSVPREQFRMDIWCGSACCIRGHLDKASGVENIRRWTLQSPRRHVLARLFVPSNAVALYTTDRLAAADAIENYLAGKDYPWDGVRLDQEPAL